MIKQIAWCAIAAVASLAGCNSHGGSQYVGQWVQVDNAKHTYDIEPNGDNFMIHYTTPVMVFGPEDVNKFKTQDIPAVFKDGVLQAHVGFMSVNFAIDQRSGLLTDGHDQYERKS